MWSAVDRPKTLWIFSSSGAALIGVAVYQQQDTQLRGIPLGLLALAASALVLYGFLRLLMQALIRQFRPSLISEHIPNLVAGTAGQDVCGSWWVSATVSGYFARREFDAYIRRSLRGVSAQLQALKNDTAVEREELLEELRHMKNRWCGAMEAGLPRTEPLRFTDPIHSSVSLRRQYEPLLRHPLMQRLHEVRQLAFAFPAFPGGTHSRFAHSLGAAHLAQRVMRRVLEVGVILTPAGEEKIALNPGQRQTLIHLATIAALVHDAGHPPLGHTLDRVFGSHFEQGNAVADKKFLPDLLVNMQEAIEAIDGIQLEDLLRLLPGEETPELEAWEPFISDLVDSDLDVDRLDYLQRDGHFTGQQEGLLTVDRLVESIRPFRPEDSNRVFLSFEEHALSDIEQFVYARDVMYLRCYEHPSKVVSEALAVRAIRRLLETHDELRHEMADIAILSDAQLVELISRSHSEDAKKSMSEAMSSGAADYVQVAECLFRRSALEDNSQFTALHLDFHFGRPTLLNKVRDLERQVAAQADVDPDDVVVVLPDVRLADERKPVLKTRILVAHDAGYTTVPLLDADADDSPSDMLRRRRFVHVDDCLDAVDDPERLEALEGKGFSLLSVLREARFKLRLFTHVRALDHRSEIRKAFEDLGVREMA